MRDRKTQHGFRTSRASLTFGLAVLLLCAAAPMALGDPSDTVDVLLTVEPYVSVEAVSDVNMGTVKKHWIGNEWTMTVSGQTAVNCAANVPAILKIPTSVTLTDGNDYTVGANLHVEDPAGSLRDSTQDHFYYNVPAGGYEPYGRLVASYTQTWTAADLAGTYTGTVLLEIYPEP